VKFVAPMSSVVVKDCTAEESGLETRELQGNDVTT